jgi:hypothetical protein
MTRHFRKLAGYLNNTELKTRLRTDTNWYHVPISPAGTTAAPAPASRAPDTTYTPRLVQPRTEDRYVNCLPLIPLKAAAGAFSDPQYVPDDADWDNWVAVDIGRKLHRGMFVAEVTGTRNGCILLIQLQTATDPETNARDTVNCYGSTRTPEPPDSPLRHLQITLPPLSRDYQPIILTAEDEGDVTVIAEFVQRL